MHLHETNNLSSLKLTLKPNMMPFKNMQTLKFKIQPAVTPFIDVNHCTRPLRKQKHLAQQGQKVMSVHCFWQISIHFVGFCIFCGQPVVAVIMIDSSKKCTSLVGVEVRICMLLKGAIMIRMEMTT